MVSPWCPSCMLAERYVDLACKQRWRASVSIWLFIVLQLLSEGLQVRGNASHYGCGPVCVCVCVRVLHTLNVHVPVSGSTYAPCACAHPYVCACLP